MISFFAEIAYFLLHFFDSFDYDQATSSFKSVESRPGTETIRDWYGVIGTGKRCFKFKQQLSRRFKVHSKNGKKVILKENRLDSHEKSTNYLPRFIPGCFSHQLNDKKSFSVICAFLKTYVAQ